MDNAAEKHSFNFSRLHILEPSETNSDNFHTKKRNFIYFPVKAEMRGSVRERVRERKNREARDFLFIPLLLPLLSAAGRE